MGFFAAFDTGAIDKIRDFATLPIVRWIALLGVCAAYLQGAIDKAFDFNSAVVGMQHLGLAPAVPLTMAVIALEFAASLLILSGIYRWVGAIMLAGFTLMADFIVNRFWEAAPAARFAMENSFFEHFGLIGAFILIAWHDLQGRDRREDSSHDLSRLRP
jgi:uncharacterized membrane protein YphA (DoxX/SURF4 family)